MSITRWDPWTEAMSLREAMDSLLQESVVRPRGPGRGEGRFGGMGLALDSAPAHALGTPYGWIVPEPDLAIGHPRDRDLDQAKVPKAWRSSEGEPRSHHDRRTRLRRSVRCRSRRPPGSESGGS